MSMIKDLSSRENNTKTGTSRNTQTDTITEPETDRNKTHTTEYDTDLARQTTSNYYTLFISLEYQSRSIPEATLRANLDTQEELDLFRDTRKDLTHFLIAGSKTINTVQIWNRQHTLHVSRER